MKNIAVLGDGQVWDLRGIDSKNPRKNFEDLFSGRALGEKAQAKKELFEKYKERAKSRITGISVRDALINKKDRRAREAAEGLLKDMGRAAARGIEVLNNAQGFNPGWSRKELGYWKDLNAVIIGGGVSKGKTGAVLVKAIKDYLKANNLRQIQIIKAKFPGKEAGFLGAVAKIIDLVSQEANKNRLSRVGIIGLDLGRAGIGVGILAINPKTGKIITSNHRPWIFRYAMRTQGQNKVKDYLKQKELGLNLRDKIMEQFVRLILMAKEKLENIGLPYTKHITAALPGEATEDGYLSGSTHYLPFFRKQDGFHFSKNLESGLGQQGYSGFSIHIINDGIAAGLANLRFGIGLENLRQGKYAFLGPGSGLGGCLCQVKER